MKKVLIIILVLIVIAFIYGLISWNFFKTPTFFSLREDCFPKIVTDCVVNNDCISDTNQSSFWRGLFGSICISE